MVGGCWVNSEAGDVGLTVEGVGMLGEWWKGMLGLWWKGMLG